MKRIFKPLFNLLNWLSQKTVGLKLSHVYLRYKSIVGSILKSKAENKYVFILSPPFCGSTLLTELIATSKNVSLNNLDGTKEGQLLPKVMAEMFVENRWSTDASFNWPFIKKEWLKYWDISKPILLEKSPPNIVRPLTIAKHFEPSFFIVFFRNPYAHAESFTRRGKMTPNNAANFVVECLKHQKRNIETLKNVLLLPYEELTNETEDAVNRLIEFLPELVSLNYTKIFKSYNYKKQHLKITDLTQKKIANLTKSQIKDINSVYESEKGLLQFFGYELMND